MRVGHQRSPHVEFLPCNDTAVNIWASLILRDDRNRVDTHRSSTYSVAGYTIITVGRLGSVATDGDKL